MQGLNQETILIDNVKKGVYLLQLISVDGVITKKVIINK